MDDETRHGVRLLTTAAVDRRDPAPLDFIDAFITAQRPSITGVFGAVTGAARDRTVGSLRLLDDVANRVDGLRGSLRCGGVAGADGDDLGPLPSRCGAPGSDPSRIAGGPTATGGGGAAEPGPAVDRGGAAAPPPGGGGGPHIVTPPAAAIPPSSTPKDRDHTDESLLDKIGRLLRRTPD
jgi:hypothetical protein